ncbi:MAG: type II toxin-antitoxin system Phd/YefM family antitoxin [Rickettsia sp.]
MKDLEQDINKNDIETLSSTEIEDKKPAKLSFIEYLLSMPKCDELDIQRATGKAREFEF